MYTPANIGHQAYIQRELMTASVFNVLLCVFFTYVFVPGEVPVALWGAKGIAVDLVPTVFMLTLIGNSVITLVTRQRLRSGKISPMLQGRCGWLARHVPRHPALRLLMLAAGVTLLVVPLSVLAFWMLGVQAMRFEHYLWFKACYGPLVGALTARAALEAALAVRDQRLAV